MRWLLSASKLVGTLTRRTATTDILKKCNGTLKSQSLCNFTGPLGNSLLSFSSSSALANGQTAAKVGKPGTHLWSSNSSPLMPQAVCGSTVTPLANRFAGFRCIPVRSCSFMEWMHRRGPVRKKRDRRKPLDGRPMMKGVVLKTLIKKPRKPNSANRKCVLVRLSNGREAIAYVPGEGHNLQEHNIVLVRCGRLQDVPGVKLKVIRGKYDCAHVKKKAAL